MKLKKKLLTVAIATTLVCGGAQANDEKYQQLEAKIASLEAMLLELKQELGQRPAGEPKTAAQNTAKDDAGEQHSYQFGGFVKATGSFSAYSDGDLASGSVGRDFYIPGTIPVGGEGEDTDFDFSAKESRINFKSSHQLASGDQITTFIEMDFLLAPSGNERVSNSYQPRLRHAFIKYNDWLFGQTWSTFQDVGALPESVDFLAAPDGIIFERQPMVRYTNGPWQLALENPETTVTPFGGGGRIVSDDNGAPDFVAKYTHQADWGHVAVAGLFRYLELDQVNDNTSETGYGLSITGKYKIGDKNDLRFNLASGVGMGRYVALNTANAAVLTETGALETIDSTAFAVAYRHHWNDQLRSNFILSRIEIDNDADYTGLGVSKSAQSAQFNLLYSPVPKITLGVGFLHGKRELESGADGELNRLIFSAKYAF
ncbi:DcaP family trimeric outer membrane transporter [Marinicella meishanensis]|uniref:DcaP family trimeric outer membrane transporter n=1 Tax=Marinicella meishanensis TaxID=2873263 RepID=UPI001CC0142B|nr:DcaP family trimeric outer membrane transporter [Marinicella sp. NBU2979]